MITIAWFSSRLGGSRHESDRKKMAGAIHRERQTSLNSGRHHAKGKARWVEKLQPRSQIPRPEPVPPLLPGFAANLNQAAPARMTPDIQIAEEAGVIRVVYRGDVEYRATTEMLRKVAQLAAEKKIKQLLFDVREANYQHYYVQTVRHAEEGPALGIDRTFRIAFLGSTSNPMLRYIENVTVNRGYEVKAFTGDPEAEAWLRSAL